MTPLAFYTGAKRLLVDQGYQPEIDWQERQCPADVTESGFLREAAWVVYCCGFREATVRRHFDFLSLCFFDWSSARDIAESGDVCIATAMTAIANRRKHEAVLTIASKIASNGFRVFRGELLRSPLDALSGLPYIGPVTALHLAKNLGFEVAKPDRHLVRLKDQLGFIDVHEMCSRIAEESGDPVSVVDLVLWRYLESKQRARLGLST
jgi:hypothetical protein